MSPCRVRRCHRSAKLAAAPDLSPSPLLLLLLLLPLTLLGAATGQTITGGVFAVGSVGGDSKPITMRTASGLLPASSLVLSNGKAMYKMLIPSLQVEDIAGSPNASGYVNAVGRAALFGNIADFALTRDGRWAYVADEWNHCVRLVDVSTGSVTTFAGANRTGDVVGPLPSVLFDAPSAVTLSPGSEAFLYVADSATRRIVKIDISAGQASYVSPANWNLVPLGLTMGTDQNKLFVSISNNGIYTINPQDATFSVLDATPKNVQSLCATSDGKYLFVTDTNWNAVRVVDLVRGGSRWICNPGGVALPPGGPQQPSGSLDTCLLGQPLGIVQVDARAFYISDVSRTTILRLVYNADFALTTVLTTRPTTVSTPAPPTFAPPPVFTAKALSTTVPPTTASVSPAGNGTTAGGDGNGTSLALPLGVGLSVALLVALGFGLCVFFAVRDYRKNKNNPVTPFSRAVSFAVRSFRNSFGRGRFQHDGRRPLAESNGSLASSAVAAGGSNGRAAAAASFDVLPGSGVRRPASASAGRQDRLPVAAAASGARQQPRQLDSSQPAGVSLAPAAAAASFNGVKPPAEAYAPSNNVLHRRESDQRGYEVLPSYDVLHRRESDQRGYEVLPSSGREQRPGSLATSAGGPNGAAAAASYGRGFSQAPVTAPPYGSDPYAPAAPAHAVASTQQHRVLPPGAGDVGGPLSPARPGPTNLYGPSAASSYRASAPSGRGVAPELPLSPSRLAASPEARSPLSYGFAPLGHAQWTPSDNGQGQLGRATAGGTVGSPDRLGAGEPARSVHL